MAVVGGVVETTVIEPVEVLYRGHNKANYVLNSASKTTGVTPYASLDGTDGNLPTNRPLGVLSGMVAAAAAVSGENWGAQFCNATRIPIGIFLTTYENAGYEGIGGLGSGIVSIVAGPALLKVYIFETKEAGAGVITYALDDPLYSSANGLLTQETGTPIVGYLTHVPTTAENWLGVELRV